MSRDLKKSKFIQPKKSNTGIYVIAGVAIVAVLAVGGFMLSEKPSGADAGAVNVGATSYQQASFLPVNAAESNGDIMLDLNQLKSNKTETFNVPGINFTLNNGTPFNNLPLLAYVSPNGNIVVAASLCEPCSGTTFHIEGDQLVCNTCGTRWSLNGLQGVAGGCTQYPPESVKYTIQGGKLIIKKADVQNWKPRQV